MPCSHPPAPQLCDRNSTLAVTANNNTGPFLPLAHNLGLQCHVELGRIPMLVIPQPCVSEALIWVGMAEGSGNPFHPATTCRAESLLQAWQANNTGPQMPSSKLIYKMRFNTGRGKPRSPEATTSTYHTINKGGM